MKTSFFVSAKKKESAPIYIRLSDGRNKDFIVPTGKFTNPARWDNKKQTIKFRLLSDSEKIVLNDLDTLKRFIKSEYDSRSNGDTSKQWLSDKVAECFGLKKDSDNTLNDYIAKFIADAEKGLRKNKQNLNFVPGSIRAWKGFQGVFNRFQGIYTDDEKVEYQEKNKAFRPLRIHDFDDINNTFYTEFVERYLPEEGYKNNTIGRFVKELKFFMHKSLIDKKHRNREFEDFRRLTQDVPSIYLNETEIEKIFKVDLSKDPRAEIARDCFVVLCETALRISDYKQIDLSVRSDGLIDLYQQKTGDRVIIPLTSRMKAILKKYKGKLPYIHENYVNEYIKSIAFNCGFTEKVNIPRYQGGLRTDDSVPKWKLITCHTGRRSAATNMYLAGLDPIDIMKITGHKSQKIFYVLY